MGLISRCACGHIPGVHAGPDASCALCECSAYDPKEVEPLASSDESKCAECPVPGDGACIANCEVAQAASREYEAKRMTASPYQPYANPTINPFIGWPGHKRYYELLMECARIHARKNSDYADNPADPLANFRECENFGVSAADGCLTRLSDKWKRLCNLVRKEKRNQAPACQDEGINDTCVDGANYFLIYRILREERGQP